MDKLKQVLMEMVTNNWALKALALFLALITYQGIRDTISFKMVFDVPVEVKVEKGIAILDQNPRTVEVTFQGSQADLGQLSHGQMKIILTPKATNPSGSELITIEPDNVHGASGVSVEKISPKEVQLTFDRESEKKVAIAKPDIKGQPLIGKVEIDYTPNQATIKGPKRRLDERSILDTEPVDVDGRVQSFTKRVKIIAPADAMVTTIDPSEVEVKVSIVTDTVTHSWTNVTVKSMTQPELGCTISIDPPAVTVTMHGREDLLAGIRDKPVKAFVDCMEVTPGTSKELPVNVFMPAGTDLTAAIAPETVMVTVVEPPAQGSKPEGE
jgi:YbbR domain-containing protein